MSDTIPVEILEELEQVRSESSVNMMDRKGVQRAANEAGLWELVGWIEDNKRRYMEALMAMGNRRTT